MTTAAPHREVLSLSASVLAEQERHATAIRAAQVRLKARSVTVPVKDDEVRAALRALGQPVCLFGERAVDRRERLRRWYAEAGLSGAELPGAAGSASASASASASVSAGARARKEAVHTEAPAELIEVRRALAPASWAHARERLRAAQAAADSAQRAASAASLSTTAYLAAHGSGAAVSVRSTLIASQIDDRPVTSVALSPDGAFVATGNFGGVAKVWDARSFALSRALEGHTERVVDVAFQPAPAGSAPGLLATASADCTVRVWSGWSCPAAAPASGSASAADSAVAPPSTVLSGHVQRVARVAWNPVATNLLASTSYDHTWRLYDAATGACVLLQDGHAREVYGVGFHPDGALVCTGDLGGAGRVWDLRNGKTVFELHGHLLGVLDAAFHDNGFALATSSLDNTVRVWDLRQKRCLSVLTSHTRPIPRVRFLSVPAAEPDAPAAALDWLLSASHDRSVRVWASQRAFEPVQSLTAASDKCVMGMDVRALSPDTVRVVTAGYDRTWRAWELRVSRSEESGAA